MVFDSFFRRAFWGLAGCGLIYAVAMGALTLPVVQRNATYVHKFNPTYFQNLNNTEQFGFLHHQIQPFAVTTPDNVTLFAWHILPTHLYSKHEKALTEQADFGLKPWEIASTTVGLQLLLNDPTAVVVLACHGNAGHLASNYRPSAYQQMLGVSTPEKPVHVIAFDYRGFGLSTGSPTEEGVIQDAVSLLSALTGESDNVKDRRKTDHRYVDPAQVVLVGQSMGTFISTATYYEWVIKLGRAPPKGLITIASFTSLPNLLESYSFKGLTPPILSPLMAYPRVQEWLRSHIVDKWDASSRLVELAKTPEVQLNLVMLHARNDYEIPWQEGRANWEHILDSATNGLVDFPRNLDREEWKSKDDLDDMDYAGGQDLKRIPPAAHRQCLKRSFNSRSYLADDPVADSSGMDGDWHLPRQPKCSSHNRSQFEGVPNEVSTVRAGSVRLPLTIGQILNKIVTFLPDDQDLHNLMLTCTTFAYALTSSRSAIWRQRFNSAFDWPFIVDMTEFASAYQLRKFVLQNFVEFTDPDDERLQIQLEVLRDMLLESYNQQSTLLPRPSTSRNLAAFASVVISHLLLSPASRMASTVRSSRTNYDLAIVYNWGSPLTLLYPKEKGKGKDKGEENEGLTRNRTRNKRHRDRLRRPPQPSRPTHKLDTRSLLHIRNFWHRHLIQTAKGSGARDILTENTYAKMARELMRHGITPKPWDRPLAEGPLLQIPTEWYGHYSTLANWPRKRLELEEVQSLAEDWHEVDPMKLDFAISADNQVDGFWSPIFKSVPAFQKTLPDLSQCVFIRGLAPFVQLSPPTNPARASDAAGSQSTLTLPAAPELSKYHPYLALRLRGVVHSIPAQALTDDDEDDDNDTDQDPGLPGFKRVVMILYKPNKRYLIQVLEHAEEEYGETYATALTAQMAQGNSNDNAGVGPGPGLDPAPALALDNAAEIDARLDEYLRTKLVSNPLWRDGANFDRDAVEEMEEKFRLSEYLEWNDIDYAYAYEGALLPGGKIMLGKYVESSSCSSRGIFILPFLLTPFLYDRWWRITILGDGEGLEWSDRLGDLDEDVTGEGQGLDHPSDGDAMDLDLDLDLDPITGMGSGSGSSGTTHQQGASSEAGRETGDASLHKKRERGPFVFWCR
ncbi:hypothetical protein AYO20_06152 [Fonsecaea nubica]|uniref:AB hydrolase-1 domain-containing protein n=1 Tax=Fonsecaea nubica TaxID=856822 RepID=A0A178CZ08_9EURO|nr:hypothetical protein AYO20_06152 [Fonsecaea nubica]OAL34522.1 hypothetical protein AYO20_06152 [Fonsecaea nubica]